MICFFGASVTQQKNGYAKVFCDKYSLNCCIYGYGGMHLYDAGVCYIDNVIILKPEVCFIDFFTTAYTETNKMTNVYLDTIVFKLNKINCKIVFLFFWRRDNVIRQQFYNYCKEYILNNNLQYIDLCEYIQYDEKLLRDIVHTTNYGSQIYAECIYEKYFNLQKKIPKTISQTKLCDMKEFIVGDKIHNYIELHGNCNVYCLKIIKDCYCGIVDIIIDDDNENVYHINTWDEWCNFDRISMIHINKYVKKNIKIIVSQQIFDTNVCKNKDIDFNIVTKILALQSIFYCDTNNDIKINSYE
jgi:hypothetical protein